MEKQGKDKDDTTKSSAFNRFMDPLNNYGNPQSHWGGQVGDFCIPDKTQQTSGDFAAAQEKTNQLVKELSGASHHTDA